MAKMNKEQLNVSVSKEAKTIADTYGASDPYSSTSNFVESAIWYLAGARERERELKYEECKKELERVKAKYESVSSTLLRLLTEHKELVPEANERD
jgi:hypothetical protein